MKWIAKFAACGLSGVALGALAGRPGPGVFVFIVLAGIFWMTSSAPGPIIEDDHDAEGSAR